MKLQFLLISVVLATVFFVPCQGLFGGESVQDYVESLIDFANYKLSLNDSTINRIWTFFKLKYGRVYSSIGEEKQRLQIFRDHVKYVLESNLEKFRPFELALNEFADWTLNEFNEFKKGLLISTSLRRRVQQYEDDDDVRRALAKLYHHHRHQRRMKRNIISKKRHSQNYDDKRFFRDWFSNIFKNNKSSNSNGDGGGGGGDSGNVNTQSFDWRDKKAVGTIKDQLKCGGCYAFATAAVMESLYAIKTKSQSVVDLSPQQIIDCSTNGNLGCGGGLFGPSVQYILGRGGKLATYASYPYAGKKQTCQSSGINDVTLGNIEYRSIPSGDEKAMAEALVTYGPLFIGLDTDSKLFMFYKAGVLKIDNCPTRRQDMDHAMAVVGYGYDSTLKLPYWIIKNSWGTKWGENGYIRLVKDSGNMCGISTMTSYAKLT